MKNVGIIGVSGYTGVELLKILLNHPYFNLIYIASSSGEKIKDIYPFLDGICDLELKKADVKEASKILDLVFLALPHKTSAKYVKEFLKNNVKVVDLSADYRLSLKNYQDYYCPHEDKENLIKSVYGLPELNKEKIGASSLVANPGCYPTASILSLLAFTKYIDEKAPIFIDAKSGVSGAGRKFNTSNLYVSINENIFAYNALKHRHSIEISEKLNLFAKEDFFINFVPHLIPITRGILVSSYFSLKEDIDENEVLRAFYKDSPFIRIRDNLPDVKSVLGTNFCDIFVKKNRNILYISAVIDNLLRGASSQAIVNANLMFGLDEKLGINNIAYVP